MPKVTYIEASGVTHVIDVPVGENVMRGAFASDGRHWELSTVLAGGSRWQRGDST